MRSGTLRHPIAYLTVSRTDDGQGGQVSALTTGFTSRAAIKPVRGSDVPVAGQETYLEWLDFTVRYRPGYETTGWISYQGRNYEILQITDNGLKRELTIRAGFRKPGKAL